MESNNIVVREKKKKKMSPLVWAIPVSIVGAWVITNIILLITRLIIKQKQQKKIQQMLTQHPWYKWMSYLPNRNIPVKNLVLPGSHDCGSYQMKFDDPKLIVEPFGVIRPFLFVAKGVIEDWSINQNDTLYMQCMSGMRVFDVRCSQAEDGSWWIWHGFKTVSLENALNQFYAFVSENPSELLILWVRVDSALPSTSIPHFDSYFAPYQSIMMDHNTTSASSTVAEIVDHDLKNWMVYGDSGLSSYRTYYGDYAVKTGKWFNQTNVDTTLTDLNQELNIMPDKNTTNSLFVQQYIITPRASDFVWGELSRIFVWGWKWDLQEKNQILLDKFSQYATANADKIKGKVSTIWGDFLFNSGVMNYIALWNNLQFPAFSVTSSSPPTLF